LTHPVIASLDHPLCCAKGVGEIKIPSLWLAIERDDDPLASGKVRVSKMYARIDREGQNPTYPTDNITEFLMSIFQF
jgi:hypothetical protein